MSSFKLKIAIHLIAVGLLFSLACVADLSAREIEPAVQPQGWVYDAYAPQKNNGIGNYLAKQFALAKARGLRAYVYVYSDRNMHCRSIRALMKREDMQQALAGTHIVMINHIAQQRDKKNRAPMSDFTPIMAKISENGSLTGSILQPELLMFYPWLTKEPMVRAFNHKRKWNGAVSKHIFAKVLKKYFQAS